jgi:hypothetical protein
MEMKRIAKGKNIVFAGYDAVDGVLAVQFAKSGTYRFKGVPEVIWVSLQRTPFPDRYFSQAVKGKFAVEKPEKEPKPLPLLNGMKEEKSMEFYRKEDGLTFTEEGHRYEMNGQRIISLTQILDACGLVDYSGIDPTVLANKAKFGTKIHEYTLWNDQGELDMDDLKPYQNYFNCIVGWRQFCEDFNFACNMEWAEVPCAVKLNGMLFGMTVDRFGTFGSKEDVAAGKVSFGVVEIKTCADRKFSHQIQTAAQTVPFRGDGSVAMKRYAVYLLSQPNGSGRCYFAQEHTERMDEKIFLAALMLTQTRINNKLLKGF